MSVKAIKRPVAVLKMPAAIGPYISYVRAIIEAMNGNAFFQNPDPALSVVTSDLNALADAESLALNRVIGSAGARDVQKAIVDKDLYGLHAYVQRTADTDPANALAIIESAGMHVRKNPAKAKSDFEVKHGNSSGTIILSAKAAAKRASYEWQVSSDKINWKNCTGYASVKDKRFWINCCSNVLLPVPCHH